jgi:glycosyltransferase involved in cell wall biosynthesis
MTAVYAIPVCKLLNIKLINGMVVDTPVKKNILNKNWLRAQLTFPFSNIIIGNSQAGLAAYKAPAKKSLCIYNGIDLNRFENLKEPNSIRKEIFGDKSDDLFIVGMVAAFEVRKDYKTLIDAAIALISSQDKLRFILVGGGAGLNEIKSAVPSSLLNKIVFLGQRSNVESFINIFDVGVLLTNAKVHGEGISNSILEYMALGKPVIASRGGGTNEVIIENETGLLIDPNKKEQLIEKIDLLMKNKNRESIGQRGKNLVGEKFNLKTMVNNYTHVYRTLLTQKKSYHLIF